MEKTLLALNIDGAYSDINLIFEQDNEQESYLELINEMGDYVKISVGEKNEELEIEFVKIVDDPFTDWTATLNIRGLEMQFYYLGEE